MNCVEKAIFFDGSLTYRKISDFRHLYIGDEFCERNLPSLSLINDVLTRYVQNGLKLALITPYLSNKGMDSLAQVINYISEKIEYFEIIINDWATLKLLEKYYGQIEIILGRILVSRYLSKFHSKRFIQNFTVNKEKKYFYCLFPNTFIEFIKEKNISRLEFNSYEHLVLTRTQLVENGLKSHFYYPYIYLTTSRYCLAPKHYDSYLSEPAEECNRECNYLIAIMNNKYLSSKIFIKGNTYFILQRQSQDNFSNYVDRVVYNDFIMT